MATRLTKKQRATKKLLKAAKNVGTNTTKNPKGKRNVKPTGSTATKILKGGGKALFGRFALAGSALGFGGEYLYNKYQEYVGGHKPKVAPRVSSTNKNVRKPGEKLIVEPKEKPKASSVRLPDPNARNKAVKQDQVLEAWNKMKPPQEKKPPKQEASSLRKPGQNDPKPVTETKVIKNKLPENLAARNLLSSKTNNIYSHFGANVVKATTTGMGFKHSEVAGMDEGQDGRLIKRTEKSKPVTTKKSKIITKKSKIITKKIVAPERNFTFDDMMGARNQLKKVTKAPAPLIVDNFSKFRKKGNISGTKTFEPNDRLGIDIPKDKTPARKPSKKFLDAQIENSSGMMEDNPFPVIELEQDGRTKKNKLGRKIDKALFGWMK